jgi:hypothetical protein
MLATLATLLMASAPASAPLKVFYDAHRSDTLVGATAATFAFADARGYRSMNTPPEHPANDGLIITNTTNPGWDHDHNGSKWVTVVPLQHWYSAARKDSITFSSATALAHAKKHNYTFVRMEGFTWQTAVGEAQTPLHLYWSYELQDHVLVAANSMHEQEAVRLRYVFKSHEGFCVGAPPPPPVAPTEWVGAAATGWNFTIRSTVRHQHTHTIITICFVWGVYDSCRGLDRVTSTAPAPRPYPPMATPR